MAIQKCTAIRLVSHRYNKHAARSHHFHHIRMEREDKATAVKTIRLPRSRFILQKLDTQWLSQLCLAYMHHHIRSNVLAGKGQSLCDKLPCKEFVRRG